MAENTQGAGGALVVPPGAAEHVPLPHGGGFDLLADAAHTGGALGANRLTLGEGADGARPHHHARSTELFHVLDGALDFFLDGDLVTVGRGGLVVVPPGTPHAFGAVAGSGRRSSRCWPRASTGSATSGRSAASSTAWSPSSGSCPNRTGTTCTSSTPGPGAPRARHGPPHTASGRASPRNETAPVRWSV
ncbi:cupin domain-containing protein [Streptomyces sp. G45]|uniref:cupin domain-containing protein n=1 Tax=Streptomyces sp. G45 TaxID=3406627 RepID=UPI003C20863A